MHTLPKAITFDCYGTLIDWEAEIQRYFAQKLAEHNITDINARALQGYWEEVQFQSIQGPYLPYRQVLRETMKLAFDYFHVPYAETDVEEFANAMGRWKPFPDTRDAIVALQRYVKVVFTSGYSYLLQYRYPMDSTRESQHRAHQLRGNPPYS